MKLMVREFLASLKEREELDVILPDLLSELGFTVISRPGRGTRQHGVDVAAVGVAEDGKKKLFLFSIKGGDLNRQEWNGNSVQALRPSLDEIRDVYIPNRIPSQHKALPVVICICVGGEILEAVADDVRGYTKTNSTDQISYEEWNGDHLANLLLSGVLREELLPRALRSNFQKSVAMVDEPEVSYHHFQQLVVQIADSAGDALGSRATAARQLSLCLWVLFAWARSSDNLEAPYRCSELAVLYAWELLKPSIGKRSKPAKALTSALKHIIQTHFTIAAHYLDENILPHVGKRHAISLAIGSQNSVDINLKLFDIIGRIGLTGLWLHWFTELGNNDGVQQKEAATRFLSYGFDLISNNPALLLPICDEHAIDIALFLQFALVQEKLPSGLRQWLVEMSKRVDFSIRTHGKYPCVFTDYSDLAAHPKDRTEEYRKDATSGSILIPLLACWLGILDEKEGLASLEQLTSEELEHCTLQLWLPDKETENLIYIGRNDHGVALCDLKIFGDGTDLRAEIADACRRQNSFEELSAIQCGHWPIILTACRHYRMPVPPHFWIEAFMR